MKRLHLVCLVIVSLLLQSILFKKKKLFVFQSGLTPLHVASFMGCMNIVLYLLQKGSSPDTPTMRGETALHLAARANQTDIIRILLRNGANVDARARVSKILLTCYRFCFSRFGYLGLGHLPELYESN